MAIIRPAEPRDASPICAIAVEVWLGTYLAEGVAEPLADHVLSTWGVAGVRARLDAGSERAWVSQGRDGIDGFLWLDCGGQGFEIATLYVRPCRQGRIKGSALLDACLATVRRSGGGQVWLTVNAANPRALGFYRARGFRDDGPAVFMLDGGAVDNRRLTLTVLADR